MNFISHNLDFTLWTEETLQGEILMVPRRGYVLNEETGHWVIQMTVNASLVWTPDQEVKEWDRFESD